MENSDGEQLELVGDEVVASKPVPRHYAMSDAAYKARKEIAIKREQNQQILRMVTEAAEIGRKADTSDPESMFQCFREYLAMITENGGKAGNMAAYMAMGISFSTAHGWKNGTRQKNDPRFRQLIQYVDTVMSAYRETLASEGQLHPVLTIFWQRNFDGLTNDEQRMITAPDIDDEVKDTEAIRQKYASLPDD